MDGYRIILQQDGLTATIDKRAATADKKFIIDAIDGSDTVYGGSKGDTIDGGGGNDYLDGFDGFDYLIGGAGAIRWSAAMGRTL